MKKSLFIALALVAMLSSCVVSKKNYDSLMADYTELRENHLGLQEEYASQNEELSDILNSLAEVSGQTTSLKLNVEQGSANADQAADIQEQITIIKEKLDSLDALQEKAKKTNAYLQKTIKNLKEVVASQEEEITNLKAEIEAKDQTIQHQAAEIKEKSGKIEEQAADIEAKNEELKKLVAKQTQMIFNAGTVLEDIGDSAPEVSWKKNKQKMANMRLTLYNEAMTNYKQAQSQGHSEAAARIAALEEKIAALK